MKNSKKVDIQPGCITCGLCEFIAPGVFEVTDVSRVKQDVDFDSQAELIDQAVQGCPVRVITYE